MRRTLPPPTRVLPPKLFNSRAPPAAGAEGHTWSPSAPPWHRPPARAPAPYCSARPCRRAAGMALERQERGGAIRGGGSTSLPPPLAAKRRRNRVSAAAQPPEEPALTPRTARHVKSPGLGLISVVFRPIHPSFSPTYLRHSVSAQASYCPDVVGLLCCTAPFIVPPALHRLLLEEFHLNRSEMLFSIVIFVGLLLRGGVKNTFKKTSQKPPQLSLSLLNFYIVDDLFKK